MDNLFNNEDPVAKFDDLVGEGKKYADPEAAAKAIVEKDRFILRLQEEARKKEEDLRAVLKQKEEEANTKAFNDRIAALEAAQLTPAREPSPAQVTQPQATPVDEEAIERVLNAREKANARSRNLLNVKEKLTETFGADFPNRVKERAAELGVSLERLNEMAAEAPNAFYTLIGLNSSAPSGDAAPPRTSQNSAASFVPNSGKKNYAYYQNLRKTNPSLYHTPSVQLQEMKDATAQGEAFYK